MDLGGGAVGSVPGGRVLVARGDWELRSPRVSDGVLLACSVDVVAFCWSVADVGRWGGSALVMRTCSAPEGQAESLVSASVVDALSCAVEDNVVLLGPISVEASLIGVMRALERVFGFTLPCAAPFRSVAIFGNSIWTQIDPIPYRVPGGLSGLMPGRRPRSLSLWNPKDPDPVKLACRECMRAGNQQGGGPGP